MSKRTKIILLFVIATLIAGMVFMPQIKTLIGGGEKNAMKGGGDARGSSQLLPVNAKIMKPETLIDEIRASTATLYPDEEVDLTFETSGKITDIYFKEGTQVRKGALLAKINDKPLQAQLQKLEAQVPYNKSNVARHTTLLEKDAVSKEAYEKVVTEIDKLNADIALVKSQIAQTELRAPFDGYVGLRNVSEGAYASTSTVVTTLTKTVPLKVEFSINERYVDVVKHGTKISFRVEADGGSNTYEATVYALESKVDSKTYTRKVRALYPNSSGALFPGRSAAITIRANEIKNTLAVPAEAVVKEMGHDIVYVYRNGKAQRVELTTGMRTAALLQAVSGLAVGDTLLVSGVMQLRNDMPVKIDHIAD